MNLPQNPFLAALRAGRSQIGLWLTLSSSFAAEAIAGAGFDWVLIDMEHSPNELGDVMAQLQLLAAYDTVPIVRPDWSDPVRVKRLLDLGASGLLFPMIQNADEARRAVAATRYPPRGIRGVSGMTRANGFGRLGDYFKRVESETAVLLQVETRSALACVEEIAATDGVDGVFFGPADIAADMGHLGQPLHPEVWTAIMPAAQALIARGTPVGTLISDPVFARDLLAKGFLFVACGVDAALLARGADALLRAVSAKT
ncbi:HpcH/HpaI aldolase/citrate lyase family protein [Roseomonas sp. GCM10028921]